MKLKDMKEKHDHKFTDLLKVGIFALLMIAPLFASVSQMLYATFNKNAYQSYSGTQQIYERIESNVPTNEPSSNSDLHYNNYYYLNCDNNDIINDAYINIIPTETTIIEITNYSDIYYDDMNIDDLNNLPDISYSINSSSFIIQYDSFDSSTWLYTKLDDCEFIISGDVILGSFSADNDNNFYLLFHESTLKTISYELQSITTLDNAFYYGVDQMTKSDLFNWTQNTAIYTGVKAMTDNLQIQTNAIAILIVYWFILTIIYIIIDIVIKCFTAITHLI